MMLCREAQPLLMDYAAGALGPDERRDIEAHLGIGGTGQGGTSPAIGCAACQRELEELHAAVALLVEGEELVEPPARVRDALWDAIDREAVRPAPTAPSPAASVRWRVASSLIAATLAVIAAGVAITRTIRNAGPEAIDPARLAWQSQVAEIEREFGVPAARLVSLQVADPAARREVFVLYDELSDQVHLWFERNAELPQRGGVWLVTPDGEVIGRGEFSAAESQVSGLLTLDKLTEGAIDLVFTRGLDPPEPSDPVLKRFSMSVSPAKQ